MKKTDFRRNLESLIISNVYACDDLKLARAAALMIGCDQCTIKRECNGSGLGCESVYYDMIRREAENAHAR